MHDGYQALEIESSIINLSKSRLPDTPLNGVGQIFKKFASFETNVIDRLSSSLSELDPNSSVLVTGSYRNNPLQLRQTSDIDMIVFSRSLRDCPTYINFLDKIQNISDTFRESTGLTPVFFTTVAAENNFIYMARKERSLDGVVPVHFLFYETEQELFHLEPKGLATRLLTAAKVISGKDQYTIGANGSAVSVLDNIRWDTERSIAELVLNKGIIEQDWLFSNFHNSVYISLRRQTDSLGLDGCSVKSVLDHLDPSGILSEKFGIHFEVRSDINVISSTNQSDLLEGPAYLLEVLSNRL